MKIKLLTLLLIGCLAAPVLADDKQEKSDAKQKSSVLAITGGDIHTVTNGVIRQGTVLVKDGKIAEVGSDVAIPEGAQVIDATGKIVSPGFVAISMSGLGVSSNPSGSNKLSDSLDPFDQNLKYALGVGITSGCVEMSTDGGRGRRRSPGEPEDIFPGLEQPIESRLTEEMLDYGDPNTALCPCCGLPVLPTEPITPQAPSTAKPRTITVIKMAYGNLDAMLGKEDVFYNPAPGALNGPLNRHNWRIELEKAGKAIAEEKKKASEAANKKPAESKSSTEKSGDAEKKPATNARSGGASNKDKADEDVVKLLKGETTMRVRADSYDEISDLTDLALEYGYGLVIEGGTEAWALADKLSIAGVEVIYTPRSRREPVEGREDNSGSHFESPRIFEDKGIPFATKSLSSSISMGGLAGRDLTSLPLEAAFAVRGGASEKTALESITIAPAKMMGMEDRIGSIEVGKDADLLILNGEPLDYKTYVEQAIVQGKVAYQRDEDRVYPVYEREQ